MMPTLIAPTLLALSMLAAPPAQAQIWPAADYLLYQEGELRGRIYVAPGQDACRYEEVWYLFSSYMYPGAGHGAAFSVVASDGRHSSEAHFLRAMERESPGGTLVRVWNEASGGDCEE